ncbi:hypothetical protein Bbelb_120060 [Branchiostoma belcheri]|nr:hypothetical protein Bbelb_120060 [Branchiostoma belcheri]
MKPAAWRRGSVLGPDPEIPPMYKAPGILPPQDRNSKHSGKKRLPAATVPLMDPLKAFLRLRVAGKHGGRRVGGGSLERRLSGGQMEFLTRLCLVSKNVHLSQARLKIRLNFPEPGSGYNKHHSGLAARINTLPPDLKRLGTRL